MISSAIALFFVFSFACLGIPVPRIQKAGAWIWGNSPVAAKLKRLKCFFIVSYTGLESLCFRFIKTSERSTINYTVHTPWFWHSFCHFLSLWNSHIHQFTCISQQLQVIRHMLQCTHMPAWTSATGLDLWSNVSDKLVSVLKTHDWSDAWNQSKA